MPVTLDYCLTSPKASKNLKSLKPVFDKLKTVHEKYINRNEDKLYWCGERSHIGLLSAAVWASGGTALEEYGDRKRKEAERRMHGKPKPAEYNHGRTDLWIEFRKSLFECEAKRVRINLGGAPDLSAEKVSRGLGEAVKNVKSHAGKKGLAMCFATLTIRKSKLSSTDMDGKRRDLMKAILRISRCHTLVWIGVYEEAAEVWEEKKEYLHLGVILAVTERP
jgi:hypothetical protein